jgi:hypothetical protein
MTPATSLIPAPVLRRLMLSFLGWRFEAGRWTLGEQVLTDEQLDAMPARRWEVFLQGAAVSALN